MHCIWWSLLLSLFHMPQFLCLLFGSFVSWRDRPTIRSSFQSHFPLHIGTRTAFTELFLGTSPFLFCFPLSLRGLFPEDHSFNKSHFSEFFSQALLLGNSVYKNIYIRPSSLIVLCEYSTITVIFLIYFIFQFLRDTC